MGLQDPPCVTCRSRLREVMKCGVPAVVPRHLPLAFACVREGREATKETARNARALARSNLLRVAIFFSNTGLPKLDTPHSVVDKFAASPAFYHIFIPGRGAKIFKTVG